MRNTTVIVAIVLLLVVVIGGSVVLAIRGGNQTANTQSPGADASSTAPSKNQISNPSSTVPATIPSAPAQSSPLY